MATFDLSPPSGTRDFLPEEVKARARVVGTIRDVFESYGFAPLETPAFERLEILNGKYGDEGDKLVFKILKRGDKAASGEADFALRYDLTVPLARVVGQYRHQLGTIFKRYQIAPVWRADRPARGRFREFYQCDIDVAGTRSPVADAEVLLALGDALAAVGLSGFTVKLSSRKLLRALVGAYGIDAAHERAAFVALDKLDKLAPDDVLRELEAAGIGGAALAALAADLGAADPAARVRDRLAPSAPGQEGLAEVDALLSYVGGVLPGRIELAPFLARGLDYYTGPIFEIAAPGLASSIASGGRYDGLVGMFSREAVPACGGSLGLERILLLLAEREGARPPLGLPQVVVTVWDDAARAAALSLARDLRAGTGASVEVFPGEGHLGKQLKYAAQKGARAAIIVGPDEAARGLVTVKDLTAATQTQVARGELAATVRALVSR